MVYLKAKKTHAQGQVLMRKVIPWIAMQFGEKITRWLAENRRTKADLARMVGVTPMAIKKWLGGSEPGAKALLALSKATGLPMDYWADDATDSPPPTPTADDIALADLVGRLGIREVIDRIVGAGKCPTGPDVEVVPDPTRPRPNRDLGGKAG